MKVESYNVSTQSEHHQTTDEKVTQKLDIWHDDIDRQSAYRLDINFPMRYENHADKMSPCLPHHQDDITELNTQTKFKLIETLIYQMTGKRVKLREPKINTDSSAPADVSLTIETEEDRDGWGINYEYTHIKEESESVAYRAAGIVTTDNGQKIGFDLQFLMSRQWYQKDSLNIRMGDAKKVDPLVVAYGDGVPRLSRTKHAFDLDSDGANEMISFAIENAGFLALDKNNNGQIDNGMELFGPQSGDGFAELRAYDVDGNGWIDESDAVFEQLTILTLAQNGDRTVFKLGEVGIGAIYLNDTSTQFHYKEQGQDDGEMKSSSIFLREDGTAGTIHHFDLSV